MMDAFEFRVAWLERQFGSPSEREGFGELEIRWGDLVLTELEDLFAATVRPAARVSILHLGIWLASNWWRLRWESLPAAPDPNWRMAHEIAGAGGGFAWPTLQFAADGQTVNLSLRDTLQAGQPVRYLRRAEGVISASTFERAVDQLMAQLLGRLSGRRVEAPELAEVWREILLERQDPVLTERRRREALLGLDPDELDAGHLSAIISAGLWMGESALEETLAAARAPGIARTIDYLQGRSVSVDVDLDLSALDDVRSVWGSRHQRFAEPWQRGVAMAALARRQIGIADTDAIPQDRLSDLIGFDVMNTRRSEGPMAAGFRVPGERNKIRFSGIRRHATGRRFEAARLIADAVDSPDGDVVLPITDASTARQKVQRSFAQEFLCPVEGLRHLLPPLPSETDVEDAAEHFGVSDLTVRSALVNRGLVDRSYLPEAL
jgi:hypothetical protein